MVNKIDGNNYYRYTQSKNVDASDSDEQFSLHYGQDKLSSEPKDKKEKTNEPKKPQTVEQSGVKLELSDAAQTARMAAGARTDAAGKPSSAAKSPSILESIQDFLTTALAAIKDFFYKLWNDEPSEAAETLEAEENLQAEKIDRIEEAIQTDETNQTSDMAASAFSASEITMPRDAAESVQTPAAAKASYLQSEEQLHHEIQPYLRKGDLSQVLNLLTDNGKKTIAKNSTLLTYYDRNGRMVEPNASDRERILHGDRNTRKL
ncbi:MAG: hypothetical protein NC318_04475 [Blautia sp.]|nr:hypothetical protein [Lachnoclostridium sp.]MCM1210836.1 hypothetical protein [Blautia sp.]